MNNTYEELRQIYIESGRSHYNISVHHYALRHRNDDPWARFPAYKHRGEIRSMSIGAFFELSAAILWEFDE